MFIEFYLYGLILGLSVCSVCVVPLFFITGSKKHSIVYMFLSRVLLLLLAVPLIFLLPYMRIAGSIAMLGVGIYAFMLALEGKCTVCKEGTLVAGLVCFSEGLPAVLMADGFLDGIVNILLFAFGNVTPLILLSKLKVNPSNRMKLVFSGLIIIIAIFYLYEGIYLFAGSFSSK
ncbi:MAG: hypothetical protein ACP5JR_00070 [Thermoplasmata archaeon]